MSLKKNPYSYKFFSLQKFFSEKIVFLENSENKFKNMIVSKYGR